jgi:hypothetical protein
MDRRRFLLFSFFSIISVNKSYGQNLAGILLSSGKCDRLQIQRQIFEQSGALIFGTFLDNVYDKVKNTTSDSDANSLNIEIPENFLVDTMNLSIRVYKQKKPKTEVIQEFNGTDISLLVQPVALGQNLKGKFSTPTGKFFLRRIINYPLWIPPDWAKDKTVPKPGRNNPYGLWMSELSKYNEIGNCDWSVSGDTNIRIHSTNLPSSIGTFSSHGCIRLHPDIAEELFPAILHYTPHGEGKKTSRGIIFPLEKPIPLEIL